MAIMTYSDDSGTRVLTIDAESGTLVSSDANCCCCPNVTLVCDSIAASDFCAYWYVISYSTSGFINCDPCAGNDPLPSCCTDIHPCVSRGRVDFGFSNYQNGCFDMRGGAGSYSIEVDEDFFDSVSCTGCALDPGPEGVYVGEASISARITSVSDPGQVTLSIGSGTFCESGNNFACQCGFTNTFSTTNSPIDGGPTGSFSGSITYPDDLFGPSPTEQIIMSMTADISVITEDQLKDIVIQELPGGFFSSGGFTDGVPDFDADGVIDYPDTFTGNCSAYLHSVPDTGYSVPTFTVSLRRFRYKFTFDEVQPNQAFTIYWTERFTPDDTGYSAGGDPYDIEHSESQAVGDTESSIFEILEPSSDGEVTIVNIRKSLDRTSCGDPPINPNSGCDPATEDCTGDYKDCCF